MTEEQRGGPTEQLFKYAVEKINRDPVLLLNTTLIYDIHYVDREDSWHASKKGTQFNYFYLFFFFKSSFIGKV